MATSLKTFIDGEQGQLAAADLNTNYSSGGETNIAIASSGQTLDDANQNQLGISLGVYGSKGDFYEEAAGSASDVYVLDPSGSQKAIHALQDGMRFRFRVTNANTGASTVDINSLGAINLKIDGVDLSGGELLAGEIVEFVYKQSSNEFELLAGEPGATVTSQGIVFIDQPITISNNSSDTEHDIDFSAGSFSFDDGTGQAYLASITKQIDATWAQGDNAGGLDTGVVSNDLWYYSFGIYNPTTKESDILLSLSPDSPTLPTGYTKKKRLIGCFFKTDASSNIIQFSMHGNTLALKSDNILFSQTSQAGSTGVVSNAFPSIFCLSHFTMHISTTTSGFSSLSVWGNEGFQPTVSSDATYVSYIGTNNGFTAGGGSGTAFSSDGQLSYRNWIYAGGVSGITSALISVSDLG